MHEMHFLEVNHEICTRDAQKIAIYVVRAFKMWKSFEYFFFFFHFRKFFFWFDVDGNWEFMTDDLTEHALLSKTKNKIKNQRKMKKSFPSRGTDPDG